MRYGPPVRPQYHGQIALSTVRGQFTGQENLICLSIIFGNVLKPKTDKRKYISPILENMKKNNKF